MNNVLKLELKKSLGSVSFKVAMAISVGIVIWHIIYLYGFMKQLYLEAAPGRFVGKYNLFYWWLPVDCVTIHYTLFYYLFPLLSCLPYAWSYLTEKESGYALQLVVRWGPGPYLAGKFLANFISAAAVIALPLAADLLLLALFSPAQTPPASFSMPGFGPDNFQAQTFYSQPWLFCMEFWLIEILWAGAIASLSFCFAGIYKSGIPAVVMPTLTVFLLDVLSPILKTVYRSHTGDLMEFSPLALLHTGVLSPNPVWLHLTIIGLFLTFGALGALGQARRKDWL